MSNAFISRGYKVISGGTDNHLMLIDLRSKFPDITGKIVENTLVKADITINKIWYRLIADHHFKQADYE